MLHLLNIPQPEHEEETPTYNMFAVGCCHKPKAPSIPSALPGIKYGVPATGDKDPELLILNERNVPTGGFSMKPRKS